MQNSNFPGFYVDHILGARYPDTYQDGLEEPQPQTFSQGTTHIPFNCHLLLVSFSLQPHQADSVAPILQLRKAGLGEVEPNTQQGNEGTRT
jgi:hypothetical protein